MEYDNLFQRVRQIFQVDTEMDEGMQKEAAALIRNIFRYMDKDAKDIMTHRTDIVAIDGEETLKHILEEMLEENYSRFPVYIDNIDGIIGFIHLRDAMVCYLNPELRRKPIKELKDYIRPVRFIPETKKIDTLFKDMQARKNHVVIILDEYGQTSGLVTMEDILEEIVGNIMDEHDEEDESIKKLPNGSYIVDGMADLEDLEDVLQIELEKEEYETLNGFLVDQLDKILSEDEDEESVVEYSGYRFTVLSIDNNRIDRVKIEKLDQEC